MQASPVPAQDTDTAAEPAPPLISAGPPIRVTLLTNMPVPYRVPVLTLFAQQVGIDLTVLYCSSREPDRAWQLSDGAFRARYLPERMLSFRGRFIHYNAGVWQALRDARPDVVITTGFNPVHLSAFAYALCHRLRHIAMTDGTATSEQALTPLHRWVRRFVFRHTAAFIGASEGSFSLYRQYGLPTAQLYQSHLCADNQAFERAAAGPKRFDLLFAGRFVANKNPVFVLAVAAQAAQRLGRRLRVAYLGSGPLEGAIRAEAERVKPWVDTELLGFAQQHELPGHYAAARVFLFPTTWEPWGVVANEACAAGLPVIVTPEAGVAGDLVVDGDNGLVRPLDLDAWADAVQRLLGDEALYAALSARARTRVARYTYANAARGLAAAVAAASGRVAHPPEPALRPRPLA